MPQEYDWNGIPITTKNLELCFEFDLSRNDSWSSLSEKDHQRAVYDALDANKLIDPAVVVCRSHIRKKDEGPVTLETARVFLPGMDSDDAWLHDPKHRIRIDFVYSAIMPQLVIRIVNDLSLADGVTASRIAFSTLEVLENGRIDDGKDGEGFKKNPPFTFGFRNFLFAVKILGSNLIAAIWPFTPQVSAAEAASPTTGAGLRAYYATRTPKGAAMRWYRPVGQPNVIYKQLLVVAQNLFDPVPGWKYFFNLLNFSPKISVSLVNSADDTRLIEKRYEGAFAPISTPPTGYWIWMVLNYVHVTSVFMNNYGRHSLKTKAIPRAFTWDWLGFPAPLVGIGFLSINGQFMAWLRGTETWIRDNEAKVEAVLGPAVGSGWQSRP